MGNDLRRIGIEVPEQLGALFLMDGEEIDRITGGIAPLTDFYPKHLSDAPWDEQASHRLLHPIWWRPPRFSASSGLR